MYIYVETIPTYNRLMDEGFRFIKVLNSNALDQSTGVIFVFENNESLLNKISDIDYLISNIATF